MSEWISVKEREPDHLQSVFCYGMRCPWQSSGVQNDRSIQQVIYRKDAYSWKQDQAGVPYDIKYVNQWCIDTRDQMIDVTHWMPLPAPSKEER